MNKEKNLLTSTDKFHAFKEKIEFWLNKGKKESSATKKMFSQ